MFRLCPETGCRRNELLGFRVRDLAKSAYGWTATLDIGAKLGSKRSLPITHRWLENQSKNVRAFNPALGSTTEVFFTGHVLRHTAASLVATATTAFSSPNSWATPAWEQPATPPELPTTADRERAINSLPTDH